MRATPLPRPIGRAALRGLALVALCALAACSSTKIDGPATQPRAEAPQPVQPTRPPAKGGGYYLDDGPGDGAPTDLDKLPDAEPRNEPAHRFANNPYVVFGVTYTPMRDARGYRQRGIGSWYGRRFHGQRTSSGEPYDMYAMTAAHPTLPIPSYVRVTNVANGRTVVVRVNDRGPFLHNRVIDLSYAAAYRLGYVQQGSAMVEVEAVFAGTPTQVASVATDVQARQDPPAAGSAGVAASAAAAAATTAAVASTQTSAPPPVPVAAEPGGVFVQLGAFSALDNAESARQRMSTQLAWLDKPVEVYRRDGLFRLHVGPYRDRTEARRVADQIGATLEMKPSIVVR
jgi:rare lipoprotein A